MKKPYFKGQESGSKCGCYYPDITGLGDDGKNLQRLLYCKNHGFFIEKINPKKMSHLWHVKIKIHPTSIRSIPNQAWRDKEIKRLKKML